jgi:beta-1,4-N-acetylglucosaminyltransferase
MELAIWRVCALPLVALVASLLFLALRWLVRSRRATLLVVLGSGGHTAEMLQLMRRVVASGHRSRGMKRVYVVAKTDALSAKKAEAFEASLERDVADDFRIERIDRAREVGQSYVTSVLTTLVSFVTTARLVLRHRPGMVLVNGPGTCLPIVVWARVFGGGCLVYYVESIARVDHVSLTGRVLLAGGRWLANGGFYVQWPELAEKLGKDTVTYAGRVY